MARILGLGLLAVLAAPALALVPGMMVDRGSDGVPRVSAFPAALVVFDPLVWRCVRNSVAVALVVTIGSLVVGVGLGLLLGRRRFWGRWPLGGLALAPMAVGPTWITPGVVGWIGGGSGWEWLAARSFLGQPGDDWARWLALAWTGLACSAPLAILATSQGLARVDPAWADAARVVGAGRWRVWADVTWPTLRPGLGRVAGLIFTLALVEPAGPTILGLRRTLAVELADAASRSVEPNRAAALATIAVVIATLGRGVFARWGGDDRGVPPRASAAVEPRAGLRLGAVAVGILAAWAAATLGPVARFGGRLVTAPAGFPPGRPWGDLFAELAPPEVVGWLANSAITAALAVGLALTVVRLAGDMGRPSGREPGRWPASTPPLALAAGALTIPPLLVAAADLIGLSGPAALLRSAQAELSPGRGPGLLLVLVLAAAGLPARRFATRAPLRDPAGPVDAALLAGASGRSAARLARRSDGGGLGRSAMIAWTWASTDLASAWLLAPLPERRTAAVAALDLVSGGGNPGDPRLLGLLIALTGTRLVGLALLARSGRPRLA